MQIEAIEIVKPVKRKKISHTDMSYADIADWIMRNLSLERSFSRLEMELLFDFGRIAKNCDEILFYPSSFTDIKDIIIVDLIRDTDLDSQVPKIFIHNDAAHISLYYSMDRFSEYPDRLVILGSIELVLQNGVYVNIIKFKRDNAEQCWLVQISYQDNEDTLKLILENKWRIRFLYSVCDAILHGMGTPRIRERDKCIPGLLYTYFAEELGTKYHFSDFPISRLLELEQHWFNNVRDNTNRATVHALLDIEIATFCNLFSCHQIDNWHLNNIVNPNYHVLYLISKE
jgi:hypothetical protein